ncbi:class I SAM-dependent methyltransferase [Mesorhizobium sp.]|uniref:class I SAM-dependent methyltransferase n=1 Tax=Mesorhizobium sp. TaxID=1871066 RepID=UPI000FE71017|nr:class I SAM-dependent methyltransferase [Mesorhizobium sp.]RWE94689.1 MAG: SAM-dependent methyltransferase [Mesorhizobium sp.]
MSTLKGAAKRMLPASLHTRAADTWLRLAASARLLRILPKVDIIQLAQIAQSLNGKFERTCPICKFRGYFKAYGSPPRLDARCPVCGSLERHRLLYLAIQSEFPLKHDGRLLHFAPERATTRFVRPAVAEYVTADISGHNVDHSINIEQIDLQDSSFDTIICSHVLEHVDDRSALSEMYRVLRPKGVLYLMTPVIDGWETTYEHQHARGAMERELHFGQGDHLRYYGRDLRDRILSAGFLLDEYTAFGEACVTYGLWRGERIFVCRKG